MRAYIKPETRKTERTMLDQTVLPKKSMVQRTALQFANQAQQNSQFVHAIAEKGRQGSGNQLPHFSKVQSAFGHHDLRNVKAHTGSNARTACQLIGAQAYATGNDIVFAESKPSVHTVAHEATHILQQAKGVQLKGGVGQASDRYEQQADAVAAKVERGQSATNILNRISTHPIKANHNNTQQVNKKSIQLMKWEWKVASAGGAWRAMNETKNSAPTHSGSQDGEIYDDKISMTYATHDEHSLERSRGQSKHQTESKHQQESTFSSIGRHKKFLYHRTSAQGLVGIAKTGLQTRGRRNWYAAGKPNDAVSQEGAWFLLRFNLNQLAEKPQKADGVYTGTATVDPGLITACLAPPDQEEMFNWQKLPGLIDKETDLIREMTSWSKDKAKLQSHRKAHGSGNRHELRKRSTVLVNRSRDMLESIKKRSVAKKTRGAKRSKVKSNSSAARGSRASRATSVRATNAVHGSSRTGASRRRRITKSKSQKGKEE